MHFWLGDVLGKAFEDPVCALASQGLKDGRRALKRLLEQLFLFAHYTPPVADGYDLPPCSGLRKPGTGVFDNKPQSP